MTDETLSALIDGECSPAEVDRLLDEMERNPALQERFSRLCLERDSRQGIRIRRAEPAFSSRVMASIEGRPAATVIAFRPRWMKRPIVLRSPALGFAAAATVAAVVVFAVRPGTESTTVPVIPEPVSAVAPAGPDASYKRWAQLDAQDARQLGDYVMTYSRSRADQGMGSTLGYARYAAHPQEQDAAQKPAVVPPMKDVQP